MVFARDISRMAAIALGGIVAIGSVAGSGSPVVGAEQAVIAAPVPFSGGLRRGMCPVTPTEEVSDGLTSERGGYCNPSTLGMTDPRLAGFVTKYENSDAYLGGIGDSEGDGFSVGYRGVLIENEGGAWRQLPVLDISINGMDGSSIHEGPRIFVGQGGYEGLIVVAEAKPDGRGFGEDLSGYIIDSALPPIPEPLLAEE